MRTLIGVSITAVDAMESSTTGEGLWVVGEAGRRGDAEWDITRLATPLRPRLILDVPHPIRGAIHRQIRLPVTVIVTRHRHIPRLPTPLHERLTLHIPDTIRRTIDRDIGVAITVIVTRHRHIPRRTTPLHKRLTLHIPDTIRRTIDRHIRVPVTIEIGNRRGPSRRTALLDVRETCRAAGHIAYGICRGGTERRRRVVADRDRQSTRGEGRGRAGRRRLPRTAGCRVETHRRTRLGSADQLGRVVVRRRGGTARDD